MVGLFGKGGMQRLAPGRLQLPQRSDVNGVKFFDPSNSQPQPQTDLARATSNTGKAEQQLRPSAYI
jgi:hypothetical protein